MPHNIGQGIELHLDMVRGSILLDTVSEQVVVLRPQLFIRSEQGEIVLVIAILVRQVLFYFFLIKNRVLLLVIDPVILRRQPRTHPFQIVTKRYLFSFLSQIDLPIDSLQIKTIRLFLFSL